MRDATCPLSTRGGRGGGGGERHRCALPAPPPRRRPPPLTAPRPPAAARRLSSQDLEDNGSTGSNGSDGSDVPRSDYPDPRPAPAPPARPAPDQATPPPEPGKRGVYSFWRDSAGGAAPRRGPRPRSTSPARRPSCCSRRATAGGSRARGGGGTASPPPRATPLSLQSVSPPGAGAGLGLPGSAERLAGPAPPPLLAVGGRLPLGVRRAGPRRRRARYLRLGGGLLGIGYARATPLGHAARAAAASSSARVRQPSTRP